MTLSLLLCLACSCGLEPLQAPRPEGWHVSRGALRAPDGRAVILRGVNLAGAHKQWPYFGFHQQADFRRVRDEWGMNSVRLLIMWAAIEPQKGEYDAEYIAAVKRRLDWAADAGLYVVLDMHQDIYGEGFGGDGAPRWTCDEAHYEAYEPISPWFLNYLNEHVIACFDQLWSSDELIGRYAGAWRELAARLGDHEAVVGFDVMNEPHWGSTNIAVFEETFLQPFYERVVAEVRAEAPGWVAFLEPASSRNVGQPTGLTPLPFPNVVYAPHSYDSEAEQGNGFDASGREAVLANISLMREEASHLGAALWIGEYGGVADHPGIVAYMDAQYDGSASVAAGSAYWAYDRDEGYGMLRSDGSEKSVLLDVLVRPYPELVAGDPLAFSYDDRTGVFEFSWRPDDTLAAPTEISLPARAYPGGYSVTCEGCTLERLPQKLLVTAPPGMDLARLSISP